MSTPAIQLDLETLRTRLIGIVAALVVASIVAVGATAVVTFERAVEPELVNRTRLIGSMIRSEIQHVLELGVPFDAIVGLEPYLAEMLEDFDEVQRISVSSSAGETIAVMARPGAPTAPDQIGSGQGIAFHQRDFAMPILDGNELVGEIRVEISPVFIQTRMRDVFLDVTVIALVAMVIALELALAVAITSVGKPLDRVFRLLIEQQHGNFLHCIRRGGVGALGRAVDRLNDHAQDLAERAAALPQALRARYRAATDARVAEGQPIRLRLSDINDIRLALFLFSVATEVAAAFLPVYAQAASRPDWMPGQWAAAAPLLLYLIALALLSPVAGGLARRFGARRMFLASVPPTAIALAAMGFSEGLAGITFWRGVIAVFYATATVACQEYAIRAGTDQGGARPIGAFVAVIYGGVFCGSALGGVIAGRFGFGVAFVSGASITLLSGLMGLLAMRGRAGDPEVTPLLPARRRPSGRNLRARHLALMLGIAVPMNAVTAIFIWYLTPLMLADLGAGPAEIARVVMLYYLAIVLFGPRVAKLADSRIGPRPLVVLGALASGTSLLSLTAWSGFWAILLAVTSLGLSHTLMRTPLYALTLGMMSGEPAGLSVLRLIERIGAIFGLALSALLLDDVGANNSVRAIGIAVLTGLLLYVTIEIANRARPIHRET